LAIKFLFSIVLIVFFIWSTWNYVLDDRDRGVAQKILDLRRVFGW